MRLRTSILDMGVLQYLHVRQQVVEGLKDKLHKLGKQCRNLAACENS